MTKITGRNINFEGDTPSSGDGVQIISNQGIKPLKNNLSASDAPDSGDDFSAGYSVGSLWQWGARVWRCYGDGEWSELLTNPSGAADGKILGHAGGVPAWVTSSAGACWARRSRGDYNVPGYLTFDTNTYSGGTSGQSSYGIRVPNTGLYLIGGQGSFYRSSSGSQSVTLSLGVNTSSHAASEYQVARFVMAPGSSDSGESVAWVTVHPLSSDDYVTITASVNSLQHRHNFSFFWLAQIG